MSDGVDVFGAVCYESKMFFLCCAKTLLPLNGYEARGESHLVIQLMDYSNCCTEKGNVGEKNTTFWL